MSGFVPSRVVGSPAVDEEGYPLNGYDEVVPGLAQADTTFTPTQLFDRGFDAVFDVCGWNRGDGVADRPYVFYLLDDVPWIPEPERIHQLGREIAALVLQGNRVAVNCAAGLNRSGLLVGRALVELGHPTGRGDRTGASRTRTVGSVERGLHEVPVAREHSPSRTSGVTCSSSRR